MSNRKHRDNQEICARKVRELAQSGVNKHCFECSQPGVTYTDITAGCFVCTSCSGMLRGLNPPHRVKSISMTTFSQQEVEFLQNHGNEVGRRTWLCVFDPKTDGCSDMKDSQKFKEFLQDKYEKKKWHFSKSMNRRDVEGPWSPGVQAALPPHGPLTSHAPSHNLAPNARSTRPLVRGAACPYCVCVCVRNGLSREEETPFPSFPAPPGPSGVSPPPPPPPSRTFYSSLVSIEVETCKL
uniref:ArfGAP with FG repeats 2 n=1 Tax=Gasterosteus aculeatus aculeatus TaxID=481459 RepID=A0AAQ4RMI7_GASAC